MHQALPVTVLGGYLGSGKTTLVNHLLRNAKGSRLAIMVNDFGDLPIDASLIETKDEDIISLSGGCICCSYGNDLTMALLSLRELSSKPDHIVIESSGVALPGAIASSLSLLSDFELEGIVVLADAATVLTQAADRYVSDTITRQLQDADLILLNKLDLVDSETAKSVQQWLHTEFTDTPIVSTTESSVPNSVALGLSRPLGKPSNVDTHSTHAHAAQFDTLEIALPKQIDITKLITHLTENVNGIIRAKGFATDLNGDRHTIQIVGKRWRINPAPQSTADGLVCIGLKSAIEKLDTSELLSLH